MEAVGVLRRNRWLPVAFVVVGLLAFGAVGLFTDDSSEGEAASQAAVAELTPIEGTDLKRVTLTAQAAERVGIEAVPVQSDGALTVVPYSAVLYDTNGSAWVYVATEPLEFVRQPIVIDRIEGDRALLTSGPAPGANVVTIGAAELYGAELEVDH